jgi:exopolysaccharide production protein ExoZ
VLSGAAGQTPPVKRTIDSLQAGRGLAALAVVVLHSAIAARDFGGHADRFPLASYGYLGVDFFFVLSGFIIFHSTVGRGRSARDYAAARFRRVFLPYWPVGLAMAAAYVAAPPDHSWAWLPTLTLAPVEAAPALNVAWTLKHEILFYLLFGLFYYAELLPLGLVAWLAAILLGPDVLPFRAINLEFFFGIAAAVLFRARRAHPALIGMAALPLAGWVLLGAGEPSRVLVGLAFALAIAPVAQLEERGRFVVPAPLVWLGAASYSLYLVHSPIVSVVARLLRGHYWGLFGAGVAASLLAGFGYHLLVERRVIRKKANPEVFKDPAPAG